MVYFSRKTVPRHKHSFWYYFGGLTLFFLTIQLVTGILLALYYKPSPEGAYESIRELINHVPYGWLVRSLHAWSANLMIGCLFVHAFSTFLMKAYRKPRELMWVSGSLLLFLSLGFGFTGYLLPWDTMAYFATLIGTEVPKTVPLIGNWGVSLLKGEDEIGAATLTRMYTIHIVILPLTALVVVSFHLLMNQVSGSSIPIEAKTKEPPIPFFPNFMYRDLISWVIGFSALFVLSVLIPWGLGDKADPLASAPIGIKPEWYFLPLYQTLRIVPSNIFSINGELLVNGLVGIASVFWFLIPFLDRRANKETKSRVFTVIGVAIVLYLVGTMILAYTMT
jgi:cytochrome b6